MSREVRIPTFGDWNQNSYTSAFKVDGTPDRELPDSIDPLSMLRATDSSSTVPHNGIPKPLPPYSRGLQNGGRLFSSSSMGSISDDRPVDFKTGISDEYLFPSAPSSEADFKHVLPVENRRTATKNWKENEMYTEYFLDKVKSGKLSGNEATAVNRSPVCPSFNSSISEDTFSENGYEHSTFTTDTHSHPGILAREPPIPEFKSWNSLSNYTKVFDEHRLATIKKMESMNSSRQRNPIFPEHQNEPVVMKNELFDDGSRLNPRRGPNNKPFPQAFRVSTPDNISIPSFRGESEYDDFYQGESESFSIGTFPSGPIYSSHAQSTSKIKKSHLVDSSHPRAAATSHTKDFPTCTCNLM